MQILPKRPTTKASAATFTGDAWFDTLVGDEDHPHLRAAVVHFAPGARNAWHMHALGQTLFVTEGVGRIQSRGQAVVEMQTGDTVRSQPGEWHWHGAAPDRFMTHITMYEAPVEGEATTWGDHVTDAEYLAAPEGHRSP